MRILLLSRYGRLGASSRVRSLQYLPYLRSLGWQIDVQPLFSNDYLSTLYAGRTPWRESALGYWRRIRALVKLRMYDLILLEKELFPFLPASIERFLAALQVRYVVDYDDALFHRYDQHSSLAIRKLLGRKIDTVMRHASLVIAGNDYLADRAKSAGARQVEIIPTVVDLERYSITHHNPQDSQVVGWIGTPQTGRYLLPLAPVFDSLKKQLDIRIVAVGANSVDMANMPINVLPWTEETEVQSIQQFDIGIMPLEDSPWERGKCGYKLIQYMACGLPVVASPVGVNTKIVESGQSGFFADKAQEWGSAIRKLVENPELRSAMGTHGRQRVEDWFSLQVQASRLERALRTVVE